MQATLRWTEEGFNWPFTLEITNGGVTEWYSGAISLIGIAHNFDYVIVYDNYNSYPKEVIRMVENHASWLLTPELLGHQPHAELVQLLNETTDVARKVIADWICAGDRNLPLSLFYTPQTIIHRVEEGTIHYE